MADSAFVFGVDLDGVCGDYTAFFREVVADELDQVQAVLPKLLNWGAERKIKPHISHQLPLAQPNEALELIRDRKSTGKVVIDLWE